MEEIWKTVRDAPNYEVSNEGLVRNKKTGRILKQASNGRRSRVVLMSYGERLTLLVEDLIKLTFNRITPVNTGEIWRPVNCAWEYEVSNQGNVRNKRTGRILKPYPNNHTGRPQVTLTDAGYRITRPIHLLVEEAFAR